MSNNYYSDQILTFNHSTDDSVAIFMIHPVGGQVHWYREVVKQFDTTYTIYALLSEGLLNKNYSFYCMEELGQRYLKTILTKPIPKCYIILGWSFGCEVAFEITKSLLEKQHNAELVLLDPQVMKKDSSSIAHYLYHILRKEFNISVTQKINLPNLEINTINHFINDLLEQMLSSNTIKASHIKYYDMSLRVYLYNLISMYHYQRKGEVDKVLLALSESNEKDAIDLTMQAQLVNWQPNAKTIKMINLHGDHYTMLQGDSALHLVSEIKTTFLI